MIKRRMGGGSCIKAAFNGWLFCRAESLMDYGVGYLMLQIPRIVECYE
jgi:hypothetical protein